ncbi:hypothetical protein, partial [Pseudomonas syringae group genomosp. 3]|uniref:hypothetical protein n=1 Tax=Pseudomonas syringae group genomosp. 3 TaxID=251701 RepID=UPI001C7FD4D9
FLMPLWPELQKSSPDHIVRRFSAANSSISLQTAPFQSVFPHYRRTSPIASSYFRTIQTFDEANRVACCAVF